MGRRKKTPGKTGVGQAIKDVLASVNRSYQQAAEDMTALNILQPAGEPVNKALVASYAGERNTPPAWFLTAIVKTYNLDRNHFGNAEQSVQPENTTQASTITQSPEDRGISMKRVPLLHFWEDARLHELMTSKDAWAGDRLPVPDFLQNSKTMAARVESDEFVPLLQRGDALLILPNEPLMAGLDYVVTLPDGSPDVGRTSRTNEGGTSIRLLRSKSTVEPSAVRIGALIVGKLPQYNPLVPHGSWNPLGYVLDGSFGPEN